MLIAFSCYVSFHETMLNHFYENLFKMLMMWPFRAKDYLRG